MPGGGSTVGQLIVPDDFVLPVPAQFEIRVLRPGERAVRMVVAGELDLETSPQLQAALEQEIDEADELILDLSQVEFIDSTGLQAILVGVRASEANGNNLAIRSSLAPQARRLFNLVGLLDRLPLIED
jgi:anti-sigma B factor antagonist